MSDEEFDALRDDIEQHGQRDAIVLWDGQILDGRHRMQACLALGIEPKFRTVEMSWEEAKAYVLSVNLTRRHLDTSQRAIIASRMATLEQGRPAADEKAQIQAFSITQREAAESLNVGRATLQQAKKLERVSSPEVVEQVANGKMSLHKASKLAAAVPDKAEQAEIIKAGRVDEVLKKALPPEEPPALPKTNTLHSPATQQQIDRGPELAQPTVIECGAGLTPLQHILAQHTRREVLAELVSGYEGEQRKRVFADIRAFLDEFDPQPVIHDATEKPAAKSKKHPTADQLMFVAEPYATKWSGQLMTQVWKWAEYKQSLAGNAKVRSLASWDAMLTRIDNVQKMRGPGTVCEMLNKAIANGWQGWEHESSSNGKPTVASTRIDSGEDYSDLEYRTA
jgi:ParB-like chromosome segregation protein Spo0J